MGETSCNAKEEMKKGPWTREEDQKLLAYIQEHGHGSWRNLPAKAGLQRCGKSCRLRWTNYLRPDIKRGKFSPPEEKAIIRLHALLGNRWSAIATYLPQRTDNEIKNYWNTRLKKRLTRMGIDPVTHKPKNNPPGSAQSRHAAALSHMAQWEAARLEAEARLARESKLLSTFHLLHRATAAPPPPLPHLAVPPCLDVLKAWQATTNPSRFFSSHESPTSTLDFSSSSLTVPTVSSVMANDVVSMNSSYGACGVALPLAQVDFGTEINGKMENSLHDDHFYHMGNGSDTVGPMDLPTLDHDPDCYGMVDPIVGEFEDGKSDWNDLLDLVCSTMVTHPL